MIGHETVDRYPTSVALGELAKLGSEDRYNVRIPEQRLWSNDSGHEMDRLVALIPFRREAMWICAERGHRKIIASGAVVFGRIRISAGTVFVTFRVGTEIIRRLPGPKTGNRATQASG